MTGVRTSALRVARRRRGSFVAASTLTALLAACGSGIGGDADVGIASTDSGADSTAATDDDASGGGIDVDAFSSPPVWYGEIESIYLRHCGSCHRDDGIGGFSLVEYEAASAVGRVALEAIETRRMPPWMPDPDCREYVDERRLSDAEILAVRAWLEGGALQGDPARADATPAPTPPTPSVVARPAAPYTPSASRPDDYRCFVLDADFEVETYVRGIWVEADAADLVHHVLVYPIEPGRVAEFVAQEAAEDEPGFTCFGVTVGGPVAWYVPGTQRRLFDNDEALVFPAGTKLLMQVHYNTLVAPPRPDHSTVALLTDDAPPTVTFSTVGFPNGGIVIPAGDGEATFVSEFENTTGVTWVVREVAGHMHLLGSRIALEVVRSDGEAECLLDVPDWKFEWQQFYGLPRGAEVWVRPGDSLRMTCTYDNSASNQPVVNGERLAPRTVRWGDGTLDEMCLTYITVVVPHERGVLPGICREFEVCRAGCADPNDYGCLLDCSFGVAECGDCFVDRFFGDDGCVRAACGLQASAAAGCYTDCRVTVALEGGDVVSCMEGTCPDALERLTECVSPRLRSGVCDAAIRDCTAP